VYGTESALGGSAPLVLFLAVVVGCCWRSAEWVPQVQYILSRVAGSFLLFVHVFYMY
jgi:hypothetical protein